MSLEEFRKNLLISDYSNVKSYSDKKSIFSKAWSFIINKRDEVLTKIENLRGTNNKGLCLQDRELNFQNINKDNKIDLFKRLDELKKENA